MSGNLMKHTGEIVVYECDGVEYASFDDAVAAALGIHYVTYQVFECFKCHRVARTVRGNAPVCKSCIRTA